MSNAGLQILAGRIAGERIASSSETTVSAGFTSTETVIHTIVAPLVIGRRYGIWLSTHIISTVAADDCDCFLREDSVSGTLMQRVRADLTATNIPFTFNVYAEYTAVATGNKTFVGTGDRVAGTGTLTRSCSATIPGYMWVNYLSG